MSTKEVIVRVVIVAVAVAFVYLVLAVVFGGSAQASTRVISKRPHTAQVIGVVKDCKRGPPVLYTDNKGRTHVVQKMTYNTGTRAVKLWTPKVSDPKHVFCTSHEG